VGGQGRPDRQAEAEAAADRADDERSGDHRVDAVGHRGVADDRGGGDVDADEQLPDRGRVRDERAGGHRRARERVQGDRPAVHRPGDPRLQQRTDEREREQSPARVGELAPQRIELRELALVGDLGQRDQPADEPVRPVTDEIGNEQVEQRAHDRTDEMSDVETEQGQRDRRAGQRSSLGALFRR
jgi:hypothetical protein